MKKKQTLRRRHLRLVEERTRRNLRRRILARERRAIQSGQITKEFTKPPVLYAPEQFDLLTAPHREEVLRFLRLLRDLTVGRGKPVVICFSRTKKMIADGTLLFLAEIRRITELVPGKLIRCRRIHDSKVGEVLHHVGFFEAIGRRSKITPTAEDVIHWRAISGCGAEGEKADSLVQDVRDRLPDGLKTPMYDGLVEAMTNSTQHAYLLARRDGLGRRGRGEWWMFARQQGGQISVVFCDLGIGIPNSLPLTHEEGVVRELLAKAGRASGLAHSDADLVEAAVAIGRSRTRERHRGKGLQDVVEVIKTARNGSLIIHSNKGCYMHQVQDGVSTEQTRNYRHSILGTLIHWTVPVRTQESES